MRSKKKTNKIQPVYDHKKGFTINYNRIGLFLKSNIFSYSLIFISAFLVYGRTYYFSWGLDDGFIFDSLHNIENNWHGFSTVFSQKIGEDYRPFTIFVFWLEKQFFYELKPNISHLINVFIFACLLIQIFRFIVVGKYYDNSQKLYLFALLVVLFFLVHPTHVCVVANIKSRDNLLSMLMGISGTIYFLQFLENKKILYFFSTIIFFSLAILSKLDSYAFILFCIIYFLFYKVHNAKQTLKVFLYFIVIIIIVLSSKQILMNIFIDKNITGRMFVDSPLIGNDIFLNRLSLSLTTMFNYLALFFYPVKSFTYYGVNQIELAPLFSLKNSISFFAYLSMFIFSVYKFKYNKIYLFSFVFYLLSIAYASNIPSIVSGVLSERYNFIGSLGLTMFVSALIIDLLKIENWKNKLNLLIIIPLVLLLVLTVKRTHYWKDTETLLLNDVKNNTKSAQAFLMLSSIYINAALFDKLPKDLVEENFKSAEIYVDKGLSYAANNPFLIGNKGILELSKGDNQGSISYFYNAYQLDTTLISNVNYIGIAYRNLNNIDSAMFYFKTAMNKSIEFSYAANNYVEMLIRKKQFKAVDSTLLILSTKYPNDKYLKSKIQYLKESGGWYAF